MDARKQVKIDLCNYFLELGAPRKALPKVTESFVKCVEQGIPWKEFFASRDHAYLEELRSRYLGISAILQETRMTKAQARDVLADPCSSQALIAEADRVLG